MMGIDLEGLFFVVMIVGGFCGALLCSWAAVRLVQWVKTPRREPWETIEERED